LAENKLSFIGEFIFYLENGIFVEMSKLQILDLSNNNLKYLPTSIGYLQALRTLLIAGNPFEDSLQTLISPLTSSYDGIQLVSSSGGDNKKRLSGSSSKIIKSQSPGIAYLNRLQGYLADEYDLELKFPEEEKNNVRPDIDREQLQSMCRIPVTNSFDESYQRLNVINELIETEKTYVDQLSAMIDIYLTPLAQQELLEPWEMKLVFSNIQEIFDLHSR
jgi:Leucine-rich repeat (LRR) protein